MQNQNLSSLVSMIPRPVLVFSLAAIPAVLCLAVGLVAYAYAQDESVDIAGLRFGKAEDGNLLERALIMIDGECSELGDNWNAHGGLSGRFPIGAGQGADINDVVMTFAVGQDDTAGEYSHILTIDEMPRHRHSGKGVAGQTRSCKGGKCAILTDIVAGGTDVEGGDQPHNNIPPFFVVNFCKFIPDAQ